MSGIDPISAALEIAINRVLALDPQAQARLARMQGKVIAIDFTFGPRLFLLPALDGVRASLNNTQTPDVTIRGTPFSMLRAASRDKRGVFAGDVILEGDIELGQQVQRLLDTLDIDWEEGLSHVTGDVVAHRVADALRGVLGLASQTIKQFASDAAEYAQEEKRDIVSRHELDEFLAAVDEVRAGSERLAARIAHLNPSPEA